MSRRDLLARGDELLGEVFGHARQCAQCTSIGAYAGLGCRAAGIDRDRRFDALSKGRNSCPSPAALPCRSGTARCADRTKDRHSGIGIHLGAIRAVEEYRRHRANLGWPQTMLWPRIRINAYRDEQGLQQCIVRGVEIDLAGFVENLDDGRARWSKSNSYGRPSHTQRVVTSGLRSSYTARSKPASAE